MDVNRGRMRCTPCWWRRVRPEDPKFDRLCQAIIGAGEASDAHPETTEKRMLEAWDGRTSGGSGPRTGRIDDYLEQ